MVNEQMEYIKHWKTLELDSRAKIQEQNYLQIIFTPLLINGQAFCHKQQIFCLYLFQFKHIKVNQSIKVPNFQSKTEPIEKYIPIWLRFAW